MGISQSLLAFSLVAVPAAAQIPLHPIGTLPGVYIRTLANGISADGSTVFGECDGPLNSPSTAIIWTAAGGIESLGTSPGNTGVATAASSDGGTIAGHARNAAGVNRAFRWTRATGMQELGDFAGLPGSACTAITPDGSVICGYGFTQGGATIAAFRWSGSSGFTNLGAGVQAVAVSSDGLAIACTNNAFGQIWRPGGIEQIPQHPLTGFIAFGGPVWISPDGLRIIMWARDSTGDFYNGYTWSAAAGYQQSLFGWPRYASPDGSLVFGLDLWSGDPLAHANGTTVNALDYLRARGADLSGWSFLNISGVSADLRTFVGNARSSGGEHQGWIVTLPALCYTNCDNSTTAPVLNALDFACFLTSFAAGDPYANCDNSSAPPTLNALDFGCFLTKFAAGCT